MKSVGKTFRQIFSLGVLSLLVACKSSDEGAAPASPSSPANTPTTPSTPSTPQFFPVLQLKANKDVPMNAFRLLQSSGSAAVTCAVQPALPLGLSLNTLNCEIVGTPWETVNKSYQVTLKYSGQTFVKSLTVQVLPFACTGGALTNAPFANSVNPYEYSPYKICTADHLSQVRNYLNGEFDLLADIDLSGKTFEPIGDFSRPFSGTFDGGYKQIKNWSYANTHQDFVGLFGVTLQAHIEKLKLVSVNLSGKNYVGGLVGAAYDTSIQQVRVSGQLSTTQSFVGGLAGLADDDTIISEAGSSAQVSVQSYYGAYAGGLVGALYEGSITNSYASGRVSGYQFVGGLLGYNDDVVSKSLAWGAVTGNFRGAFVAQNDASIQNSFWNSTTATTSLSGGGWAGTATEFVNSSFFPTYGFSTGVWLFQNGQYPKLLWELQ